MKKFLNMILISTAIILAGCGKNTNNNTADAKYLILKDDGVPTHSALKGRGSENYSELLDKNGNSISRSQTKLKEPYNDIVVNGDYAYSRGGSPIKVNIKNGNFENINEFLNDKMVDNIKVVQDKIYFGTNEGVNTDEKKNPDNWYKSHIVREDGKNLKFGFAIGDINFVDNEGYITALGTNY